MRWGTELMEAVGRYLAIQRMDEMEPELGD